MVLSIDHNTYAKDCSYFDIVLPNPVYASHDYATLGFPVPDQPLPSGSNEHMNKVQRQFERKAFFMREKKVSIWHREFGLVCANKTTDPEAEKVTNSRYHMLGDQLGIYKKVDISWSIWSHEDIGYHGMTYVNLETRCIKLMTPFAAKQKLALEFWGFLDKEGVKDVYEPFVAKLKELIPENLQKKKYPNIWTFNRQVQKAVREGLMSGSLVWELAESSKVKIEENLEESAKSFAFENCISAMDQTRYYRQLMGSRPCKRLNFDEILFQTVAK